jgi:hypothetical protein
MRPDTPAPSSVSAPRQDCGPRFAVTTNTADARPLTAADFAAYAAAYGAAVGAEAAGAGESGRTARTG